MIRDLLASAIAAALAVFAPSTEPAAPSPNLAATATQATAATQVQADVDSMQAYRRLPLSFEANRGQQPDGVDFSARGLGYGLALDAGGATLSLSRADKGAPAKLRISLVDGNRAARASTYQRQAGKTHYISGNDPAGWVSDVENFGKVRYASVWPGVDMVWYGNQQQLEYDFVVAPGRDPARIALAIDGARSRRIDDAGNLVLATAAGEIVQKRPISYQMIDGQRVAVQSRYRLLGDNRIGFELGRYDASQPLVIDPVLDYLKVLDGEKDDTPYAIAVDRAGFIYIAGITSSYNFPGIPPNAQDRDRLFVTKLNPAGSAQVYTALINSTWTNPVGDIAVDASGRVHLTGGAWKSEFPSTVNTGQPACQLTSTNSDVFVLRLNSAGSALEYSTLLCGSSHDEGKGLALAANGEVVVTGYTTSSNFLTINPFQAARGGGEDAFVTRLNVSGMPTASTYLGGLEDDRADSVAIALNGNLVVVGQTESPNYPTKYPLQAQPKGLSDGFMTIMNPAAKTLAASTYIGGQHNDYADVVAIDGSGAIVVAGNTWSSDFPVVNALRSTNAGGTDAFVAKFSADGRSRIFSTYFGGSTYDLLYDMALDATGNILLSGITPHPRLDPSNTFPQVGGLPLGTAYVARDAPFVSKLSADGRTVVFSTMLALDKQLVKGAQIAPDRFGGMHAAINGDAFTEDSGNVMAYGLSPALLANWHGDFNGDGKDDILWHGRLSGASVIWLGGNSATRQSVVTMADARWQIAAVGDFDGDHKSDIVWTNRVAGINQIWRSGNFATRTTLVSPSASLGDWKIAGAGDFDGNGRDDVLWHNRTSDASMVWPEGDATRSRALAKAPSKAWEIVGVGDFDGDNKADLFWRNQNPGYNVYWSAGLGSVQRTVGKMAAQNMRLAQIADFNGDGKDDLLWRDVIGTGNNEIWYSALSTSRVALTKMVIDWQAVGGGDYDGNGKADILWRHSIIGSNVIWPAGSTVGARSVTRLPGLDWVPAS
ncbi:FG-GAP-like repeat-containing protein [Montanilutibacter psychrotolerans]|nr:FG-GAP-like repeat-containing protein [Lysobacter psychrotolerans]